MELNIIYNMDCLDGLKKIPDNSINTIITSPPYNKAGLQEGKKKIGNQMWKKFNIDYNDYDDNMPEKDYQKWQIEILNECFRVLKDDGSIFYNHKIRRYKNIAYSPLEWILKSKPNLYQVIVWNRKNGMNHRKEHLLPTTEYIYWLSKVKPKVFKKNIPKEFRSEVWEITPERNNNHPAPFPKLIPSLCINLTTEENDIILDPFMGSGTTAKAAKEHKRNYIGYEITKEYIKD